MFRFIVSHLKVLKHVPFFALWFDAMMMIWSILFLPAVHQTIEAIENEVLGWQGISRSPHKFGGLQFNYAGKELGHIHSQGTLDILFTRKMKQRLIQDGQACEHHTFRQSGWVSFYIRSSEDFAGAMHLLMLSYERIAGSEQAKDIIAGANDRKLMTTHSLRNSNVLS